jgi:predicted O-methyltransferase YrrM
MSDKLLDLKISASLKQVDSLLDPRTYRWLYLIVLELSPRKILEIGTAHGAATVVMGIAAKSLGIDFHIQTIDVLASRDNVPSSRSKFGDENVNAQIIRNNFLREGLSGDIDLFIGTSEDYFESRPPMVKYDLILIDADGRIDRDLALLVDFLREGTTIIFDDYDRSVKMIRFAGLKYLDLKHISTSHLLDAFIDAELLKWINSAENETTIRCEVINYEKWTAEKILSLAVVAYRRNNFIPIPKGWLFSQTFPLLQARLQRVFRYIPILRKFVTK